MPQRALRRLSFAGGAALQLRHESIFVSVAAAVDELVTTSGRRVVIPAHKVTVTWTASLRQTTYIWQTETHVVRHN